MKQQIVIIHGGTTFDNYTDYITYLKDKEVTLEKLLAREWKNSIDIKLGKNFEVLRPRMPNGTNARYKEWKIWFNRITPFLRGNVILIGHSLGGIFLAKYLAENKFTKAIKAVILIGAPYDDSDGKESLTDFELSDSLKNLSDLGKKVYLVYSKDDPAVSMRQLRKYQEVLPEAVTVLFDNKKHFNQETFPELVKLIKRI